MGEAVWADVWPTVHESYHGVLFSYISLFMQCLSWIWKAHRIGSVFLVEGRVPIEGVVAGWPDELKARECANGSQEGDRRKGQPMARYREWRH